MKVYGEFNEVELHQWAHYIEMHKALTDAMQTLVAQRDCLNLAVAKRLGVPEPFLVRAYTAPEEEKVYLVEAEEA